MGFKQFRQLGCRDAPLGSDLLGAGQMTDGDPRAAHGHSQGHEHILRPAGPQALLQSVLGEDQIDYHASTLPSAAIISPSSPGEMKQKQRRTRKRSAAVPEPPPRMLAQ